MIIHINRKKFEISNEEATGLEILTATGYADGYELLLLQGESDAHGGEKISPDQTVALKNGMHFRAIPTGRSLGQ